MMIEFRFFKINKVVDLYRENYIIFFNGGIININEIDKFGIVKILVYYEVDELYQFLKDELNNSYISFVFGNEWWGEIVKIINFILGRIEFEFFLF